VRVPCCALAGASDGVRGLLADGAHVRLEVVPDGCADVRAVGALARLVLAAKRGAGRLDLDAPDAQLRHLAELLGLCDALGLGRQVQRQAELGEDLAAEGLEEVVQVADPPV